MLPCPVPQKFNTFNTFTIFNPALDYPSLVHRQASPSRSRSEHTVSTPHPPLLSPTGRVPAKRVAGKGVRAL